MLDELRKSQSANLDFKRELVGLQEREGALEGELEAAQRRNDLLSRQLAELHSLRAEVTRLHQHPEVLPPMAPSASPASRSPSPEFPFDLAEKVRGFQPASEWSDQGMATPEAACQTFDWAVRMGLLELPKRGRERDPATWAPYSRVVAWNDIAPDEVELTVHYAQIPVDIVTVQRRFRLEADGWRLVVPEGTIGSPPRLPFPK